LRYNSFILAGRSIIVALLPMGLFIVAVHLAKPLLGFELVDQKAQSYIVIGFLLWAAISIIADIDPMLKDKLTAMSDVTSLFPGRSKRNE